MKDLHTAEEVALLTAFAERTAALTPGAWDRIALRCAVLDEHSIGGFLGRIELSARASVPPLDPYSKPLAALVMSTIGAVSGAVLELMGWLPDSQDKVPEKTPPGLKAFLEIDNLAGRHQRAHPGVAAALRVVARALSVFSKLKPDGFDKIYAPFEPEIPLASLTPSEPHAPSEPAGKI